MTRRQTEPTWMLAVGRFKLAQAIGLLASHPILEAEKLESLSSPSSNARLAALLDSSREQMKASSCSHFLLPPGTCRAPSRSFPALSRSPTLQAASALRYWRSIPGSSCWQYCSASSYRWQYISACEKAFFQDFSAAVTASRS